MKFAARPYDNYNPKANLLIAATQIGVNTDAIIKKLNRREDATPEDLESIAYSIKTIKEMVEVMEGQLGENAYAGMSRREIRIAKMNRVAGQPGTLHEFIASLVGIQSRLHGAAVNAKTFYQLDPSLDKNIQTALTAVTQSARTLLDVAESNSENAYAGMSRREIRIAKMNRVAGYNEVFSIIQQKGDLSFAIINSWGERIEYFDKKEEAIQYAELEGWKIVEPKSPPNY